MKIKKPDALVGFYLRGMGVRRTRNLVLDDGHVERERKLCRHQHPEETPEQHLARAVARVAHRAYPPRRRAQQRVLYGLLIITFLLALLVLSSLRAHAQITFKTADGTTVMSCPAKVPCTIQSGSDCTVAKTNARAVINCAGTTTVISVPYKGAWLAGTTYAQSDVVAAAGASYVSLQNANTGHAVSDPAWWGLLAAKGDTGATGAAGTNGTDGAAATIAVGSVTTGAAGTSAVINNSGTSSAATFDFTIPRGDAGASGVPAGMIVFVKTGTCPAGWTEEATLTGSYILATKAANGDVGGTASASLSLTAAAQTVNSLTAAAQTFTGSSGTIPAHTISWPVGVPTNASGAFAEGTLSWPAGVPTNASGAFTQGALSWPAGVPTAANESAHTHSVTAAGTNGATATSGNCAATNIAQGTSTANACKATAPNLTVPAETFTGSAVTSGAGSAHTHTISWPAGVPTIAAGSFTQPTISWPAGVPTIGAGTFTQPTISWPVGVPTMATASFTPAGTNGTSAVTGTMNTSAVTGTVTPAYYKLIPCSKN